MWLIGRSAIGCERFEKDKDVLMTREYSALYNRSKDCDLVMGHNDNIIMED
jgi:hypothetical protein